MSEIPRRICIDKMTPAELAIREAVLAVEELPADVRLTDAVILLQAAREHVADFVDGTHYQPLPDPPVLASQGDGMTKERDE